MKPEEDWDELKNIIIVGYYAALAEANEVEKRKTKATSESDSAAVEDILNRRRNKNKKYRDDSISPPPQPPRHNQAILVCGSPANKVNSPSVSPVRCSEGGTSLVSGKNTGDAVSNGSSDVVNSEVGDILTPEDIRLAEIIFQDDDISNGAKQDINSETSSQSTDSLTRQLSQVMNELKNIKAIAVFTMHRVENIEDALKRVRVQSQYERNPSLLPNLPLTELCQLKSLEEKMADEQFEKQLFNMLRYTGGSRERDCVNRCLEKIFTNYLAQFCSWTGKKNNFKLSSLKLITTIKLAVRESFPNITDDGFERHVMSWFQHAVTRLKRQN